MKLSEVAYEFPRISKLIHCESQTEIVKTLRTIHSTKIAMQLMVNTSILRGKTGGRVQQYKGIYWMPQGISPPAHPCPKKTRWGPLASQQAFRQLRTFSVSCRFVPLSNVIPK